ncbi:hypothetical protein JCM8097_003251 [Rhodosporidiobolus ruineniae]
MGKQPKNGPKGGNKAGKDGKRGAANKHTYTSKRPVGGKGIFVTCVRGKEQRCVSEVYDLLDEVADRLYPAERIEKMQAAREAQRQAGKADPAGEEDEGMEEDKADEPAAAEAEPAPAPAPAKKDDGSDFDDDMEAELAALRAGGGQKMAPTKGGADAKGKAKERPRFQSIATDTECLCFIATAWPYDPVELTEAIVAEVQETGIARTRFAQRFSPISFSCHSFSVDQVEMQSSWLIEQAFSDWAAANGKTSVTYQIDPSVRSHTAPLTRAALLPLLGGLVQKLSSAPTVSSPVPSRPILAVKADLKTPDLVLLPTVLRNMYGLSVVEGALWRGKKFNLEAIAMEVRRRRAREEEEAKLVGVENAKVEGEVSEAARQAEGGEAV